MTAVAAKFRGYDDEAKKTRLAGVGSEKRTTVGNRQEAQTDLILSAEPTAHLLEFKAERGRWQTVHRWLAREFGQSPLDPCRRQSCGSRTPSYLVMQVLGGLYSCQSPSVGFGHVQAGTC